VSSWERLGGESGVRTIVEAFVDRFFADAIIGYLFQGKDRARIVQHELEMSSLHLGGPLRYGGRPIGSLHQPLRISRGHFRRRLALLRQTLERHEVPDDVREAWVAHDARLEAVVTDGTDCVPDPDTN
jgi:hemoglobin